MKIRNILFLTVLSVSALSCTLTRRMERRGAAAGIALIRKSADTTLSEPYKPNYQWVKRPAHGDSVCWGETVTDDRGKRIMSIDLQEVEVVARSKVVVERMGKVTIDFQITVPEQLQGNCLGIVITPWLENNGKTTALEDMVIRGGFYSRVQDRDLWQYDRFRERMTALMQNMPDSVRESVLGRAYRRIIRFPHTSGARLDSIVKNKERLIYYYTQDVNTEESGKRLNVTLRGRVQALDGSSYELPASDTIGYTISSMLTFVDTTTRYMVKVIDKFVEVKDRNYIRFKVNGTAIIDTLGDNRRQLERITGLMDSLLNQNEFYIDSIALCAGASPEGRFSLNDRLSRGRAHALSDYLESRFGRGIDTMLHVRWIAERWSELSGLVAEEDSIGNREAIIETIGQMRDPDRTETRIRERYPEDYALMRRKLYPLLRTVDFTYSLRRVGMIKDTVHTLEPDTLYARGLELLKNRRYSKALYYLDEYKDRNSAIALLSLGYDTLAYETLKHLPEGAENDYLRAVSALRLGKREEADRYYRRAAAAEPRLKYRAKLDPEFAGMFNDD